MRLIVFWGRLLGNQPAVIQPSNQFVSKLEVKNNKMKNKEIISTLIIYGLDKIEENERKLLVEWLREKANQFEFPEKEGNYSSEYSLTLYK